MKTINGQSLKQLFISGSNNLYNNYPEVDALNVFPVPDGDTGMNMNLTLTSGSKEIANKSDTDIHEIAKCFSRGLLMGARGNSGVITSQIFRGFAQGLEGKTEVNAKGFSDAFQKGVEVAYKAVIKPVEGTILTVVREASQYLADNVKESTTIEKALDIMIKEAEASLKRTPELLPILKEVGVVDSGGTGLVYILKGMRLACDGDIVERNQATVTETNPIVAAGAAMEEEEFGYCTEFIMELGPDSVKKPFNEKRFTAILGNHGNSLVVVHDDNIVKVHVHTMNPGSVLEYAQQFGEFLKLKIENMTEQHHALAEGAQVEQHKDLIEEPEPRKKYALVAVSSGAGIDQFFREICPNAKVVLVKGGQTMNPSSEDFVAAIKEANAENIYIFPNNSNIVMAASQAVEMIEDKDVTAYVIPSKTIPQGISSAIMFNPDASPEENFEELKTALANVRSGEVTFAIRDSEINGVSVKKDDFIGISDKEIVSDSPEKLKALESLLDKMIDEDAGFVTVLTGQDVTDEEKSAVETLLSEKYSSVDYDLREGGQPVYSFLIGIE